MLIDTPFEAETQGFQGLVDQNDRGKALVPKKTHFLKESFVWGVSGIPPNSPQRPGVTQ